MKTRFLCLVLASLVGLGIAETDLYVTPSPYDELDAPKPIRDRFRIIQTNLTKSRLPEEVNDFTSYKCERMVVVSNEAQHYFRIWCNSRDDKVREIHVYPGESMAFTFKPRADGKSVYQCTLDYAKKWATFDVYNENEWYTCPRENELVYKYIVKHDGIYAEKERKIRALFKGHNEYTLWENYDDETEDTDGLLMTGYVDGGMCANVPPEMNDRPSAITVCEHQCVILYEHYRCLGNSKMYQGKERCIDFKLDKLNKKVSSVKGC